jgi:hypothetical protein
MLKEADRYELDLAQKASLAAIREDKAQEYDRYALRDP